MTDINKHVEQEAESRTNGNWVLDDKEVLNFSIEAIKRYSTDDFISGLSFVLSKWQEAKVEEELPEVRKNNYFINVKKPNTTVRVD